MFDVRCGAVIRRLCFLPPLDVERWTLDVEC